MLREKKVSPFKSGPFSKAYQLFLNWKLWLGKYIALLVGFYILTADKARARSQHWTQRAPGQAPCRSALCSLCLSLLDTFCTETFLPTLHFAYLYIFVFMYIYPTVGDLAKSRSILTCLLCHNQILTQPRKRYNHSFTHIYASLISFLGISQNPTGSTTPLPPSQA